MNNSYKLFNSNYLQLNSNTYRQSAMRERQTLKQLPIAFIRHYFTFSTR